MSQEYFDKNINISYIEENAQEPDDFLILKHYLCSILVYGIAYLIIRFNPFFEGRINDDIILFYTVIYLAYIFISPLCYFIFRPKSINKSHAIFICDYFKRILFQLPKISKTNPDDIKKEFALFAPSYHESQAMMLIFIKTFFGYIMIGGLINNINVYINEWYNFCDVYSKLGNAFFEGGIQEAVKYFVVKQNFFYENFLLFVFSVDLVVFSFGYFTELSIFKNKIRSVDTSFAGALFCIMCYPPFNWALGAFVNMHQTDYPVAFGDINSPVTWIFRWSAFVFITLYSIASLALGTRASNLTNRGTVSNFPYNVVRHPAYTTKAIFWLLTIIPFFLVDFSNPNFLLGEYLFRNISILLAWVATVVIYYFRAITEERHLIKDPEYQEYVKKVKYRFIPFVI